MSRLLTTMRMEVCLQQRYGLLYAAAFVTLVWVGLLLQLPHAALSWAVPFVIFVDLGIVGFYFIAAMVLFAQDEQTLSALVVTPLRFWEYLTAKVTTLTALALVVSSIVVVATYGIALNWAMLIAGVVLTSLIALLVGFISVAPFD